MRRFLEIGVLLLGLLPLGAVGGQASAAEPERPNILFLFADDWGRQASIYAEADVPGGVNDVMRTPHFDRLARRGVLFRNAFVNAPSCTPCRSALLSGTRSDGHPMYNLAEAYRLTGNRSFLESLDAMADVAWNQVDKDRGHYGVMEQWEGGRDNHEKPFMMGQVMDGLREYWKLTGCARTRDLVLGMHDFIQAEALVVDPETGAAYAHTYVVKLDETPQQRAKTLAEALAQQKERPSTPRPALIRHTMFAYEQTGERRHWEVLEHMLPAVYHAHGHNRAAFAWMAAWLEDRKDDAFDPPPPIDDLKAEALGGGRVRLTWTTPAGAAVVQIKHAGKPMVERAWPDRIETHANGWAAENVEGVPPPGAAGARTTMIVEGLQPGRRVFSARAFNGQRQRAALGAMPAVEVR